jgi:hypothetical protein
MRRFERREGKMGRFDERQKDLVVILGRIYPADGSSAEVAQG